MALFQNNPHLTERYRDDAVEYIDDFYKIINDPKRFEKDIIDKCRGRE